MHARLLVRPAVITALLLLAPLAAMQLTEDVNWSPGDFVLMAALLFASGLAYELLAAQARKPAHRVVAGLVVGAVFVAVWAELAVGAVSKALARL
jgi:hypothetical protein